MDVGQDLIDFGEDNRSSVPSTSTPSRGRGLLVSKDAWPQVSKEDTRSGKLSSLGDDSRLMDAILGLNPSVVRPEDKVSDGIIVSGPGEFEDCNNRLTDVVDGLSCDGQDHTVPEILSEFDGSERDFLVDSFIGNKSKNGDLDSGRLEEAISALREGINIYIDGIFSECLTPPM